MQVFSTRDDDAVLIGRCDEARQVQIGDPIAYGQADKVAKPSITQIHLLGWVPLGPVNVQAQSVVIRESSKETEQLKNILAMLVERNGGAVHVDVHDMMVTRQLSMLQVQDPWGIMLTTEGT